MKEHGLLLSSAMVQALPRKTQTRRIAKPVRRRGLEFTPGSPFDCQEVVHYFCPYGQPGDRLWVRETYYQLGHWASVPGAKTKGGRVKWKFVPQSDDIEFEPPPEFRRGRHHKDPLTVAWHKRLGRFMPRKYSRTTLEVTAVRVERLQDISDANAKAEGIEPEGGSGRFFKNYGTFYKPPLGKQFCTPRESYRTLWESINGPGSWDKNPLVWVITFKQL